MLVGQVTGYSKGYLGVRTSAGKNVSVHVVKTTLAHRGPKPISAASIKAGTRVNISTQARGGYYKANFIYALVSGGGNPCGANPCGGNPCAKKNPCGANPCAAKESLRWPIHAPRKTRAAQTPAQPRILARKTRVPPRTLVRSQEPVRQESLRSEALTTPPRAVRGV